MERAVAGARRKPTNSPATARVKPHRPIEAVDRAMRLLLALADEPSPASLAVVAQRAGLTKPTAFRLLSTLAAEQFVAHGEEGGAYELGVAPLRLGAAALDAIPIRAVARPLMAALRDATGETVLLCVRRGDLRYNIEAAESENAIARAQRIGVGVPLYAGAASRVLLSALDDAAIAAYLDRTLLAPLAEGTIVDRDQLVRAIEGVRVDGYALSLGEFTSGGLAIACPILNTRAEVEAAIQLSLVAARSSPAFEADCVSRLRACAQTLAQALRGASSAQF